MLSAVSLPDAWLRGGFDKTRATHPCLFESHNGAMRYQKAGVGMKTYFFNPLPTGNRSDEHRPVFEM